MSALAEVAELIRNETGIVIKQPQLTGLTAALARVDQGMDAERFLVALRDSGRRASLISLLIDEVTVKETYFFREERELRALDWEAALRSAREGGAEGVRVWISACATGEEAYTLAILATEALSPGPVPVSVLATDVSSAALNRAERGSYSRRALRLVPAELLERYFTPEGTGYRVSQRIRSLVRFRRHNLVTDPTPPLGEVGFDVIACRNVLIYFELATVERVIGRLEKALRGNGTLVLGAADRLTGTAYRLAHPRQPAERRRLRPPVHDRRVLRRPLGLDPSPSSDRAPSRTSGGATPWRRRTEDRLEEALLAADGGDLEMALSITSSVLDANPLDADGQFVRGLAQLGKGDIDAAVGSLRRACYVDPSFGLAAFQLGRAYEARGDTIAARRAYQQALRSLDLGDERHRVILDYVELADVAAACRARLRAL